jgi:hypothetical protein
MIYSHSRWSIAHHADESSSLLLFFTISHCHCVALHLVLLQRPFRTIYNVLFHIGQTSVQTLPCIILEIVVRHHCVSKINIYLRLQVVSLIHCRLVLRQKLRTLRKTDYRLFFYIRV